MGTPTSPPGKTFEERWPDEAAEREWLAGPWVPIVFGGFGGLIGLPIMLAALVRGATVGMLLAFAVLLGLATLGTVYAHGGLQRWSGRLWRSIAWMIPAVGLGFLLGFVADGLCAGACVGQIAAYLDRPLVTVLVFAGSVLGSIAIAIGVDRAARRLAGMR